MPQIPFNGTADFTVSRTTTPANNSTRVNSSGLIEIVNDNVPRIDYLNQSCPALLVEPSAQNLVLRSEAFNVSGTWTLVTGGTGVNPAVTANAVISPDGTQNAETVVFNRGAGNTVSDQSTLEQMLTLAASGTYTFSVYAKATTSGDVGKQIFLRAGSAGSLIAYTLTSSWVRLSRIETSIASGSNLVQIGSRGGFTADNSVSVDLWGAQVETGAIPTSYIPTTTAAVTRAADVCSVSGVSGYIGQTEGTIYAEVDVARFTQNSIISISDGTVNNRIQIGFQSTTQLYAIISVIGANNNLISTIPAVPSTGGVYKIALAYKENDYCFAINGTTAASTASRLVPSCNKINLGSIFNDTGQLNDRIRAAAIYTSRLSNDNLMLLTLPTNDGYLPTSIWNYYLSKPGVSEVSDCLYERYFNILNI